MSLKDFLNQKPLPVFAHYELRGGELVPKGPCNTNLLLCLWKVPLLFKTNMPGLGWAKISVFVAY